VVGANFVGNQHRKVKSVSPAEIYVFLTDCGSCASEKLGKVNCWAKINVIGFRHLGTRNDRGMMSRFALFEFNVAEKMGRVDCFNLVNWKGIFCRTERSMRKIALHTGASLRGIRWMVSLRDLIIFVLNSTRLNYS
jgi:hypothetical protein